MERVGFIGLGNMGYPMAENMLATFGNLTVYNRSQKKAEILQMKGAKIAHSPMEVADSSHVIILSLPGPAEVEEIVAGPAGILSWKNRHKNHRYQYHITDHH